MKILRSIIVVLALTSVALATSACPEKKGPLEKAGEKVDKAIGKAGDKVDKALDKAKEAAEKAKDSTK